MRSSLKVQTYQRIVQKAIDTQSTGFHEEGDTLTWSAPVKAKRKSTGTPFELLVEISIRTNRFVREALRACLCRPEGFTVKDLVVASVVDTRLLGKVNIIAPDDQREYNYQADLMKFIKALEEP